MSCWRSEFCELGKCNVDQFERYAHRVRHGLLNDLAQTGSSMKEQSEKLPLFCRFLIHFFVSMIKGMIWAADLMDEDRNTFSSLERYINQLLLHKFSIIISNRVISTVHLIHLFQKSFGILISHNDNYYHLLSALSDFLSPFPSPCSFQPSSRPSPSP